jgi:hypothetical protein
VFGLFIENELPSDFLLDFGSRAVTNLNSNVQLLVIIDNSGKSESMD